MNHYFSMSNFYFVKDELGVLEWAIERGFAGVELWADVPYMYVDTVSEELLQELKRCSDRLRYSIHTPIYGVSISCVNPGVLKESIRQIKKAISWSSRIPVESITLHAGRMPSNSQEVFVKVKEILYSSLEEIRENALKSGLRVLIENIGLDPRDYDRQPETLSDICREFDMGICFDTGHAHCGLGDREALSCFSEYTEQIHVHDNFGDRDAHMPVGEGDIDWKSYRELIAGADIPVVHEVLDREDPGEATLRSRHNLDKLFR